MATTNIDALVEKANQRGLVRSLTTTQITLLGIGGVIGAGIFVLTGQAAATAAGPAIALSFILSAVGCAFAAMCYAELAAMIPVAGSAYTYAHATLGRFIAWVIGWDLMLEYLFGSATVAVGWSGYVQSMLNDLGMGLPASLTQAPLIHTANGWEHTGAYLNLPAALIVAVCTILMIRGTQLTAKFNAFVVAIKVFVIVAFISFGVWYISGDNLTPFIPDNTGKFGEYGWSGILRGAGIIFFAYIGFDSVSTLAQEAKNPQRSMPIGIITTLIVCTTLYVGVSLVMTGLVPYTQLNTAAPMAVAIDAAGPQLAWLRPLIKIAAIAGLSSVVLVLLMAQPRIFLAMASDGLLPKRFAAVHPKYGTPYASSIVAGLIAGIVAASFPIGLLGELVSIGTLLAFIIVCGGVWMLRIKDPTRARPFRTPWVPVVPILGILVSAIQMAALPIDTWLRLLAWMGLGLVIYFWQTRARTVQ